MKRKRKSKFKLGAKVKIYLDTERTGRIIDNDGWIVIRTAKGKIMCSMDYAENWVELL